jgi:hypothetical protein
MPMGEVLPNEEYTHPVMKGETIRVLSAKNTMLQPLTLPIGTANGIIEK